MSEPMSLPPGQPEESDVQSKVALLLRQSLALLDESGAPLALRARLADLIDDIASDWS